MLVRFDWLLYEIKYEPLAIFKPIRDDEEKKKKRRSSINCVLFDEFTFAWAFNVPSIVNNPLTYFVSDEFNEKKWCSIYSKYINFEGFKFFWRCNNQIIWRKKCLFMIVFFLSQWIFCTLFMCTQHSIDNYFIVRGSDQINTTLCSAQINIIVTWFYLQQFSLAELVIDFFSLVWD